MSHVNIWFFGLLASCVLITAPALAGDTVSLTVETPKPAPAITYIDKAHEGHTLSATGEKGKLTAVHFWAAWCVPCVGELSEVDAVQATYEGRGLRVLALSLDTSLDKMNAFFAEHHITHLAPNSDSSNASFSATGLPGLPGTLFIDEKGNEIARAEGPLDWKSKEIKEFIEKRLNNAP